ncbi:hypothetical protein L7F22_020428 [Adiantum nelumboides]|nr:hypothetical protein [Adiantum nelumboides]
MAGLLAARAAAPRLLLLALLMFWTSSSTALVDSSSLRAFWQQELPNTGIPEEFQNLASPLPSSETQEVVLMVKAGSAIQASAASKDFCSSAGIYCPQKDTTIVVPGNPGIGTQVCVGPFHYQYVGAIPCSARAAAASTIQANGIFMHKDALMVGKTVQLPDTSNDLQGLKFLPSSIADALPKLEAGNLLEFEKIFSVQKGSDMELDMKNTLAHCGFKSEHEVKECQASGEGVVRFISGVLGQTAVVVTAPVMKKQEVKIVGIASLSGKGEKTVACHNMRFPSLVYSCHMTQTFKLMDVSVKLASGHLAHLPAVCHMDTSYWSPSHVAFQALNVQPGKSSVCHWFPENTFLFVQGAHT